ncbi:MAG: hypothetical protein JWM95_887 [Gemmatimonadetes bacterium]|nr:hypothetical protein [Gemmatimonadota bacterium]
MFIELVDTLRCPVAHEESWLVAAADRMDARHIMAGKLGCPVCAAEYPIMNGVVDFRRDAATPSARLAPPDTEVALRLAALLDLSDSHGFAVLLGAWGNHAITLSDIVDVPLLVIDPPQEIAGSPGVSVIRCDGALPLAMGAARATAIDTASEARVASAVRATRAGGRVVAPANTPVPADVSELARDDELWVGEKSAAPSPLVTLHVRRGQ